MQLIIKFFFHVFLILLLLGIIGGVKMKTVFVQITYRGKPLFINTDHIISIVPGKQDSFWIWVSDGKEPVEITKEQNDKLLELINVIKL